MLGGSVQFELKTENLSNNIQNVFGSLNLESKSKMQESFSPEAQLMTMNMSVSTKNIRLILDAKYDS
jgi:hypothetical protein